MAMRPTATTEILIRNGISLVEDIRKAANGRLSNESCAVLAAAILSRDAHGERLYEHVPDAPAGNASDRR